MKPFHALLLPGVAVALWAQHPKPALDVLPDQALTFVVFRDPALSQAKLQGLMQRLGAKQVDPLTQAQKDFALTELPAGRQGLAIVDMEDSAPNSGGRSKQILYLSPSDPAAYLAKMKAVTKEKGRYTYTAGGKHFVAAVRDGWVILAEASAQGQLQRLLEAPPLRGHLGGTGAWLEEEDAYGAITSRGLWSFFHEMKKAASGATSGTSDASQVDGFVEKAEAELTFLAFRGRMDENGNFSLSLRAMLQPNGAWMALGRDLPLARELGLSRLTTQPYSMAAGGAIPHAWMDSLVEMNTQFLRASMSAKGLTDSDLAPFDEAVKRVCAHLKGLSMVMPTLSPMGMRMLMRVDDSRAYEADVKAEVEALASACKAKNIPVPVHFDSHEEGGFRTFGPVSEPDPRWAKLSPDLQAELAKSQSKYLYRALDGETVEANLMGGPTAESPSPAATADPLSEDPGIRKVAAFLPAEGTFFAFINFSAFLQQEGNMLKTMDSQLPKDLAVDLPPIPEVPEAPPLGISLRFDLDHWDASLAFPLETQLLMSRSQKAMEKAQAARFKAYGELRKREEARHATPPSLDGKP